MTKYDYEVNYIIPTIAIADGMLKFKTQLEELDLTLTVYNDTRAKSDIDTVQIILKEHIFYDYQLIQTVVR